MPAKTPYTEIILSGVEGDRFYETAKDFAKCRSMLVSFLYVGEKGTKWFDARVAKDPSVKWMVDSGAHSFRKEKYCPKWPDLTWFEDYALRYKDWAIQNKDNIDLCVNLDIENVVGLAKMLQWDYDIFRPMERAGVPVCYVWHENYGFDTWVKMCRDHEYVGLPGHLDEATWHKMLRPAMMNGCRVHGFAATKSFILGKVPIASADSTSWKAGERYGQTFVFESGSLKVFDKDQKDQRKRFKAAWTAEGVDWAELEKDKAEEITKVCAIAWRKYQEHTKTLSEKLAYWIKTSKPIDDLGDIDTLTQADIKVFYEAHKFTFEVTSDEGARADLRTIRAFLARDTATVFALTDDQIGEWLLKLAITPIRDTREDKETEIRQHLYSFFYKVNPPMPKARETQESVAPLKIDMIRDEELGDFPSVRVDLPVVESRARLEPGFLALPAPETTSEQTMDPSASAPGNPGNGPLPASEAPHVNPDSIKPDYSFSDGIVDPITRSKALLGVELLFKQNKLKATAESLKTVGKAFRLQKTLSQTARKMADEITAISDAVGPAIAKQIQEVVESAMEAWRTAPTAIAQVITPMKTPEADRPQNALTSERAREIGRLGGAPPGNQNARKHGMTSTRMPVLSCDQCPHVQVCPMFRPGHVCAFTNELEPLPPETRDYEVSALQDLMAEDQKRIKRALLFETFQGGIPNKDLTRMMDSLAKKLIAMHKIKNPIGQTGPGRVPSAPQTQDKKESVLARIFGTAKSAEFTETSAQEKPREPK